MRFWRDRNKVLYGGGYSVIWRDNIQFDSGVDCRLLDRRRT